MERRSRRFLRALGIVVGLVILLGLGGAAYIVLRWDRPQPGHPAASLTASRDPETLARGKYLYENTALCWSCHGSEGAQRPGEPQAGGKVFDTSDVGPGFGIYYGSNLTSDPETGIGSWTDGELVRALREGISRKGRLLFPIMPYEWLHGLSDQDTLAVVSYVRSLAPVRNAVPDAHPSFAAKALFAFGVLHPSARITAPVVAPPEGRTPEYGAYLARHASGCAECHTPRDPKNGVYDHSRPMAGGLFPFPEEGFKVTGSNLTPHETSGIGRWTAGQFMTAMKQGVRPNGTVVLPFMPWPYYARWTDGDLHAVWSYLRSLKPVAHQVEASSLSGPAATGSGRDRGQALYGIYCVACHGKSGEAASLSGVALRDMAATAPAAAVARTVADGTGGSMPGYGKTLTLDQIADLVGYVRSMSR